jgi:murein tripeptide amidase MpaA
MAQLSSYSDVFSISHDREVEEEIHPGDLVRTGPNLFPHYVVIAVNGDKAWLRNSETGIDGLTTLSRCRKIHAIVPDTVAAE